MLFAGIDVGAQSIKAVLFDGQKIIGRMVVITEDEAETAARRIYDDLLARLDLRPQDVEKVLATGWGAGEIQFADGKSSEQICAAKGSRFLVPTARTVVDMGAEGCRVMKLAADGSVEDFSNNAKCASGTGSFIELGAVYLKVPIEQMGALSLAADGVAEVSSTCAVFAESVIISNIHAGESRERIAAGIHRAAASRILELIGRVGLVEDIVMVGGAALNPGLVKTLEDITGKAVKVPEHPRSVMALGAAIQASKKKASKDSRVRGFK
jgi:predicted CoA-substrate-specific enzyme activase